VRRAGAAARPRAAAAAGACARACARPRRATGGASPRPLRRGPHPPYPAPPPPPPRPGRHRAVCRARGDAQLQQPALRRRAGRRVVLRHRAVRAALRPPPLPAPRGRGAVGPAADARAVHAHRSGGVHDAARGGRRDQPRVPRPARAHAADQAAAQVRRRPGRYGAPPSRARARGWRPAEVSGQRQVASVLAV
jgi:hypothetical protein